jgi:hypothetical protein
MAMCQANGASSRVCKPPSLRTTRVVRILDAIALILVRSAELAARHSCEHLQRPRDRAPQAGPEEGDDWAHGYARPAERDRPDGR